jgi:hypothetical protein
MIHKIFEQNGQPSDLQRLVQFGPRCDEFFAAARAKLNITKPANDKFFAPIFDTTSIIVCTFCIGFFHNAEDCTLRTSKVMSLTSTADTSSISFGTKGRWMT